MKDELKTKSDMSQNINSSNPISIIYILIYPLTIYVFICLCNHNLAACFFLSIFSISLLYICYIVSFPF